MVDDRDPVGEPIGLVEVLGGQQHGRCPGRRAPRSPPRARSGCAGRGRSSARRGTAPAGGRRAPPRGRGGGACRRSRSSTSRSPASARSKRSSSSRGPLGGRGSPQVVEAADHLEVLEPGQVLVDGRVLAGEPDLRPQLGRVGDHVEARRPARCRRTAAAASSGSARRSSFRRRSGPAARARSRSRPPGRFRTAPRRPCRTCAAPRPRSPDLPAIRARLAIGEGVVGSGSPRIRAPADAGQRKSELSAWSRSTTTSS